MGAPPPYKKWGGAARTFSLSTEKRNNDPGGRETYSGIFVIEAEVCQLSQGGDGNWGGAPLKVGGALRGIFRPLRRGAVSSRMGVCLRGANF